MNSTSLDISSWAKSCSNSELKLHQLSPYIGKLKSTIAEDIIKNFSVEGDTILDPFSGSGTIPLCASYLNRKVIAADLSSYSAILTKAKLFPPKSLEEALKRLASIEKHSHDITPSIDHIPQWVVSFFNPKTLDEILRWSSVLRQQGNEFYMACLLGILHHQRPGFLSYPSSHLVPYLRDKKYPKELFPGLYEYREVYPRLIKKVKRVFSTPIPERRDNVQFYHEPIEHLSLEKEISCIITSPPYMNALDYLRDNRLRLWFIDNTFGVNKIKEPTDTQESFKSCMKYLFLNASRKLKVKGKCVVIIGDLGKRILGKTNMIEFINDLAAEHGPYLKHIRTIMDIVPDVRRSRRNCRGVKNEYVIVYERTN